MPAAFIDEDANQATRKPYILHSQMQILHTYPWFEGSYSGRAKYWKSGACLAGFANRFRLMKASGAVSGQAKYVNAGQPGQN